MTDTTQLPIVIKYLLPEQDEAAAEILSAAIGSGSLERARTVIAEARQEDPTMLLAVVINGEVGGVYILRKAPLMNEISYLAIAARFWRQGHGRACLYDALLRSGRRPLVVETDEDTVEFYKHCGFKLVGKRKHPSGRTRYRLGWHAPLPDPVYKTETPPTNG